MNRVVEQFALKISIFTKITRSLTQFIILSPNISTPIKAQCYLYPVKTCDELMSTWRERKENNTVRYKIPQYAASWPENTSVTSSIPKLAPAFLRADVSICALDPISSQPFQNRGAPYCLWAGFSHFLTTIFSLSARLVNQWFLNVKCFLCIKT